MEGESINAGERQQAASWTCVTCASLFSHINMAACHALNSTAGTVKEQGSVGGGWEGEIWEKVRWERSGKADKREDLQSK